MKEKHPAKFIAQKMMKVVKLVRSESQIKPPTKESRKEVPMKLVTIFADVAGE